MQVVVAGGCDYYPGSATSSPGFSFSVADLRVAGEGDLLARIDRLRRQLDAEGLLESQKRLPRPLLPRTIGVITGEGGKARDDVLAALTRRGWAGRLVWAFAPVQDRHAAPAIARALADLAAVTDVEVVIVARGGGSLADLLCFCDETLCRTVALLGVPVIASVGHHTDRTLLDDVAAVSCSTPTHAAEAAVGVDCHRARAEQVASAARLRDHGRRAVLSRARQLTTLSRAPSAHLDRQRTRLHQQLREIRAGSHRRIESERRLTERRALVLQRKADIVFARLPRAPAPRAATPGVHAAQPRSAADARARLRPRPLPTGRSDPQRRRRARGAGAAAALRRRRAPREGPRPMSDPHDKSSEAPDLEAPDLEAPDLETPDLETPDLETPDLEAPDLEAPDLEAPDLETPDLETPDLEAPELHAPNPPAPTYEAPDLETPDLETPELHAPNPPAPTYEAAAARVEEIIRRLDSGEASLNETLELVSEGKTLIELCANQLAAVGDALEELRLDELVSRLEREAGA